MTKTTSACVLPILMALTSALTPRPAFADAQVQRFTLVVGANFGGAERPRLQYAVSDAERFARVLVELGGVSPANEIVLRQPRLAELIAALDRLAARIAEARRTAGPAGGRTEVLLYYSGHADEQGLLLGDDRYSYRTLRDRLDQIPADVRIAVLDACASGAFTRIKSGKARPAFLVDAASNMRGHAFLTSSAATEAAQESDRIRASYFTHYLVSGFRGAADLSGDGKVTLNEAYQFAFNETLGRTVDTRAGPQHPSYDINLSGTGDVVMTDLRQTTGTLVLGEELEGRFFVRNARKELVVELFKPRGRRVELGVEPGPYEIRVEIRRSSLVARAEIADGARAVLDLRQFGPAAVEATRRRGDEAGPNLRVDDRNRISVRWAQWRTMEPLSGARALDDFGRIEYARYFREDLALVVGFQGMFVRGVNLPARTIQIPSGNTVVELQSPGLFLDQGTVLSIPVAIRWSPLTTGREHRAIKPFFSLGVVPAVGWGRERFYSGLTFRAEEYRRMAASVQIGAGVDVHLTRKFVLGVDGGYNTMIKGFSRPVGARHTYSAPEFGLTVGWLFGRGRGK